MFRPPPGSTLFPYTTLFRSGGRRRRDLRAPSEQVPRALHLRLYLRQHAVHRGRRAVEGTGRSEEHTSELQSPDQLVCRLLLEKKKYITKQKGINTIKLTEER